MLRDEWKRVTEAGKGNPDVICPMPRKWTTYLDRRLRLVDEYLDGDWLDLANAVASASTGGLERRLNLSLARLTANDCLRLGDLLDGVWMCPKRALEVRSREVEEQLLLEQAEEEKRARDLTQKFLRGEGSFLEETDTRVEDRDGPDS